MNAQRTISEWLTQLDMDIAQLATSSRLDKRIIESIVAGRYTTSPLQRERISAALGVVANDIQWGGAVDVDHMYGHGPQFGRSP